MCAATNSTLPASGGLPYALARDVDRSPLRRLLADSLHPGGLSLTEHALGLCGFTPGGLVLDLGCGPGATLACLRSRGYRGIGLDRSAPMLAEARRHGPCLQADGFRLPLRDGSLDGIVSECVFSLMDDKGAVLRECFRALRSGGRVLVSDLTVPDEGPAMPAPLPCARGAVSRTVLRGLFKQAGFRIRIEQDHTRHLRDLAARIVWEFGSLQNFFDLWPAQPADSAACPGRERAYYRYLLIIAEKIEPHGEHQ